MELHERDVVTDVGRLHLRVGGAETSSAILFWPSLLLDGRMWLAQAEHFRQRHRVVLVDPPGHGLSSRVTGPVDFSACARATAQILDSLGIDRVHHVGCSWGALIGVTFAAQFPERIGVAVLMNGTASPATVRQRMTFGTMLAAARYTGRRRPLANATVDAFVGPTSRRTRPHVSTTIRDSIESLDLQSVIHTFRSVVPSRPDQRALLGDIAAPTMVVAGAEDPTFSVAETKQMSDGIADAKFVVFEDAGHLAALEVPEQSNQVIEEFIASHG